MPRRRRDRLAFFSRRGARHYFDPAAFAAAVGADAARLVVATAAFHEITDTALLWDGPCLCCGYAARRRDAARIEARLRVLLEYFDPESYRRSRSHRRDRNALGRDATTAELAAARHVMRGDPAPADAVTPAPTRVLATAAAGVTAVCAVVVPPPHVEADLECSGANSGVLARAGHALWVYSTPAARRYLRHLSRAAATARASTAVRVSGAASLCPRFRLRRYAVEFYGDGLTLDDVAAMLRTADEKMARAAAPTTSWRRYRDRDEGTPPGRCRRGRGPARSGSA
jgi:hypothetical protein